MDAVARELLLVLVSSWQVVGKLAKQGLIARGATRWQITDAGQTLLELA